MAYDLMQIARELDATALGKAWYGNALYVAKDISGLTDDDRAVLTRFATGYQRGVDHVALQDIANRLRESALTTLPRIKASTITKGNER